MISSRLGVRVGVYVLNHVNKRRNLTGLIVCIWLTLTNTIYLFGTLNLCTAAVYLAQSAEARGILMLLSQQTIYISHDEWSRCAPRVHKDVRPLPSARFQYAAAAEPAGLPSWSRSLRHSRAASAW